MRLKCSYWKNQNKFMMMMEGGVSSRMEVMESLSVFLWMLKRVCFERAKS